MVTFYFEMLKGKDMGKRNFQLTASTLDFYLDHFIWFPNMLL